MGWGRGRDILYLILCKNENVYWLEKIRLRKGKRVVLVI